MDGYDSANPPGTGPQNYSFFGSFEHSIDAKGRIIIPLAYRLSLGDTFTIGPTRNFQGIALYPNAVFAQLLCEIRAMNPRKPIVQRFSDQISKLSFPGSQADSQGRLLLPATLRQRMLGEAKDLEISGAFDHVRIVDRAKANAEDIFFTENLESILEQVGNLDD
jgi:MraZ protein